MVVYVQRGDKNGLRRRRARAPTLRKGSRGAGRGETGGAGGQGEKGAWLMMMIEMWKRGVGCCGYGCCKREAKGGCVADQKQEGKGGLCACVAAA